MKFHLALAGAILLAGLASAAPPVVKTVPRVSINPLIPHDSFSGKSIVLKGTSDVQGANIEYSWDFGDGSPSTTPAVVTNRYCLQATHAYTGSPGDVFTAKLTVTDTNTNESATSNYLVQLQDVSTAENMLAVEVNIAIDNGLWYLHCNQIRTTNGGADIGYWSGSGSSFHPARTGINCNAFEANGYLQTGPAADPYTETVDRALNYLFQEMYARTALPIQAGGIDPDGNGNGQSIFVSTSGSEFQDPYYQGGNIMDAIITSGTPNATVPTGNFGPPALNSATGLPFTYADIIQDMIDEHTFASYDGNLGGPAHPVTGSTIDGGWRYSRNQGPDNSANQWAAIGHIPAERNWGLPTDPLIKEHLSNFLRFSKHPNGQFGYTNLNHIGSPLGTTPSGMVCLAFVGIGRGDPLWDTAENLMRNAMNSTSSSYVANPRRNYYGLFAFVKALRLHNTGGPVTPITMIRNYDAAGNPVAGSEYDWYNAQTAAFGGTDTTNGVARTVVGDQAANGSWGSLGGWFDNYSLQTGRAILMLGQSLFEAGSPVAIAKANPNPSLPGIEVKFDARDSFHQDPDPDRKLVSYEWDFDNDGVFETSGPQVARTYGALGSYPVTLRVTDNNDPAKVDTDSLTVVVTVPPVAPTADADGPYVFCPGHPKWFLDGRGSVNPDDGLSQPGSPPDFIKEFAWELDGDNDFNDAFGAQPDVRGFLEPLGPGNYLIQLRVTDNNALSYPASGLGDQTDTDSAVVTVKATCDCVSDLSARGRVGSRGGPSTITLTWSHNPGVDHYNVYRSEVAGGPYDRIGSTNSTFSIYTDDAGFVLDKNYYYVVREANSLDQEYCQSNEATGIVNAPRRGRRR